MSTQIINLEKIFVLQTEFQLEEMLECLEKINQLIRQKNNLPSDKVILWAKDHNGKVRVGYNRNPNPVNEGMHTDIILNYDLTTNKSVFQLVVFDAINEWGLYDDMPVYGAPEENKDSGFKFTLNDVEYHYIIFSKR